MSKPAPTFPPDKLEQEFRSFMKACDPDGKMPDNLRREARRFFYVGALSCFNALLQASEHDNEDVCEARVELLHREMEKRVEEFAFETVIERKRN